ncbi:putative spermidine/putrescine transport system permease protein [Aliiroseovarius crassostreae]|uniref:ABC transporter permease n=1 Tax=Aliiroseovarius crassostreae TaxID=154981 RepID=A0A0P7IWB6_9RHOB|nr:hypothetical protein [Aliiroseovarius crassostreae]KPN63700.1 hypothetical protein AKJ29_13860 [Aliiroseovarius crassostreae]SFU74224.1 putative spermidine/putrescine transport system permease protein [Aliiroseovarius crassostreae]
MTPIFSMRNGQLLLSILVALFIAGPVQKTLPRQMFDGIRDNIEPSILAMSSLLVVISILMLAATAWLARKTS